MLGLEHWLPTQVTISSPNVLLLWAAGAVAAFAFVLGLLAYRDDGLRGTFSALLRGATIVAFLALGWTWFDFSVRRDQVAERRALETRMTDLAARALAPGSALACLNGVGNEAIETACVSSVYASPQAIAAAVGYTEARLKLLADGLDYAARDKSFAGDLDGLRRSLEADRFGILAHVLASRGCTAEACAEFRLFRDSGSLQANLRDRYFEAHVMSHSASWRADPTATAGTGATVPAAAATQLGGPSATAVPANSASKYNFPSSASIPPVSIMAPEPPSPAPAAAPTEQAPAAQAPPPKRTTANRPPAPRRLPSPPPAAAPAIPAPPSNPQ